MEQILNLLPSKDWLPAIKEKSTQLSEYSISKRQFKSILLEIESNIEKRKNGKAIDLVFLGLFFGKEKFLNDLKKKGILRHSNYINARNPIKTISQNILDNNEFFKLDDVSWNYLNSLVNFLPIYKELERIYNDLISSLYKHNKTQKKNNKSQFDPSLIATLVTFNEFNFFSDYENARSLKLNDFKYFSKENISEGISFIIAKWEELFQLKINDFTGVNLRLFKGDELKTIISQSCILRYFKEIEIDIESNILQCITKEKKTFIDAVDPNFLKGLELSYIMEESQRFADFQKVGIISEGAFSLKTIGEELFTSLPELVEHLYDPIERFRIKIPEKLLQEFCKIDPANLLREEFFLIREIEKEILLPFEEFHTLQIKENLNLIQFLNLCKAFIVIYEITAYKFTTELETKRDVVINSLSPLFAEERLISTLKNIEENEDTIDEFLETISWEAGFDKYLDLQYTPSIYVDGFFSICSALIAKSNMTRNIFPSLAKDRNLLMHKKNENYDKLIKRVTDELSRNEYQVQSDVNITFELGDKKGSDIDILAWKDNFILIIEAKDNILATDSFEFRTTLNHIKKAERQLYYHQQALKDETVQHSLQQRFGIEIEKFEIIQPLILMSNRKPWGTEINNVPIRNIHEIVALLSLGKWILGTTTGEKLEINNWKNQELQNIDIINYLDSEKKPHNIFHNSLDDYYTNYNGIIFIKKYGLNIERLDKLTATAASNTR